MRSLPGLTVTPLLLALCFLGTPTALNAHGGDTSLIHACVKKTGALRIIAADGTCKKTETALDWNVAGPAPLAVYDANGTKVGDVVGLIDENRPDEGVTAAHVALRTGQLTFVLRVYRKKFESTAYVSFVFGTSDCTGPAFLLDEDDWGPGVSPLSPAVVDITNVVFVGDRTQRFQTSSMASFRSFDGGVCRPFSPELWFVVPTVQVNLNVFAPLFSVR